MTNLLPRSGPAAQGVDPAAVLAFVDAVEADPDVELHSLMLLRRGSVVAEGWWAPHSPDRARLLYSLSKTFASMALGIAVAEGRLGLDDPVLAHLPELDRELTDARSRAIRVRHLAAMASGHDREMLDEAFSADPLNPVRGFLRLPPDADPGTLFAYSQPCTLTLALVLERVTGQRLSEYLRPRLLDPLGIGDVAWQTSPPGCEQGFSGLFARTEDVAALGLLLLRGGRWEGRQLVPAEYVAAASSHQVATAGCQGSESGPDWQQGYGYQLWQSRHGFRGDGAFGQFCLVLPEHDAVVAITAETSAMQAVLDHVWERLLPGLADAPVSGADDGERALRDRLAGLRLPPVPGRAHPGDAREPVAGGPASGTVLTEVTVEAGDDGPRLTLTEDGNALTATVGVGDWWVTEARDRAGDGVPVATSGGWQEDGTFRAAVIFLETPHRLDVSCPPRGGARTAWRCEPLFDASLASLRRPRPRARAG
jgi:CubicO group peptidase (beta-lactamase class C family)